MCWIGEGIHTALGVVRPGGPVGRVGVPHFAGIPETSQHFYDNIIVGGGLLLCAHPLRRPRLERTGGGVPYFADTASVFSTSGTMEVPIDR
ncbi:MAG: hypothetical protein ABI442_12800 [Gemmatimonadaceae bacterium]